MFRDMGQLPAGHEGPLEHATAAYLREALPRGDTEDLELGPEAIVLNVYVEPAWRRRGIADALMRALLDALAARGIRRTSCTPPTRAAVSTNASVLCRPTKCG